MKYWPTEVCPDEEIERIKQRNLENFKQKILKILTNNKCYFKVSIYDYLYVDEIKCVTKPTRYNRQIDVNIPVRYSNGFNNIFVEEVYINAINEVIKVPHTISFKNGYFKILIIQ